MNNLLPYLVQYKRQFKFNKIIMLFAQARTNENLKLQL